MSSTVPPPPKSGNGGYIVLIAVMLAAIAGLVYWKVNADDVEVIEETRTTAARTEEPTPVLDAAPPPPPPVEEVEEEPEAPAEKKPVASASAGNAGCSGVCQGQLTAAGESALRAKGGQARGCYNRALRQNATLSGKLGLKVRIGPSGNVCSLQVTEDTLEDASVTTCVTQMYRAGKFPAPQGGCVEAQIPLNFVSSQ